MKKTLKNMIICICILYFILSVGYVVIFKGFYEETIQGTIENSLYNSSSQNFTVSDFYKGQYEGKLYILEDIAKIIIISITIGTLLGLIISAKENSVVKYITTFVFGYLLYCILWTIITILINKSVSNFISNNFMNIYIDTFSSMFCSYIMFYIAIILGIILKNKIKVNSLNETLKNPNKSDKGEKIIKFIKRFVIILIILIMTVFIVNTGRKTIILINYSRKVNEVSKCNNYYIREEKKDNYMEDVSEIYHKDNVAVYKNKARDLIIYNNRNTNEYLNYYFSENKIIKLDSDINIKMYDISNYFFFTETSVKKWGSLIVAFYTDIKSEKYQEKDYYIIKYSNSKLYIDKETYLLDRIVQTNEIKTLKKGTEINEIVSKYTYEFDNVTDNDVAKPDMTGFTIEESK